MALANRWGNWGARELLTARNWHALPPPNRRLRQTPRGVGTGDGSPHTKCPERLLATACDEAAKVEASLASITTRPANPSTGWTDGMGEQGKPPPAKQCDGYDGSGHCPPRTFGLHRATPDRIDGGPTSQRCCCVCAYPPHPSPGRPRRPVRVTAPESRLIVPTLLGSLVARSCVMVRPSSRLHFLSSPLNRTVRF